MRMFYAYLQTALRQLLRSKIRALLTMLGIIIGIGSVIYIMTAGEVAKNFLLFQLQQFGTNVVEIAPFGTFGPISTSEEFVLTDDTVRALEESPLLPEITELSAGMMVTEELTHRSDSTQVSVYGDTPSVFPVNNLTQIEGRLFNDADYDSAARVIVIGERLAEEYFNDGSAVGERVKIGGASFTVIGVTEDIASGPVGGFIPHITFAPLTTARELFIDSNQQNEVSFMLIEFASGTNVESFEDRLDYVIREHHDIQSGEDSPFIIASREAALDTFSTILLGVQLFISAVAAISLVVGGIGIMNIMLVTVKERTKEIGLRKAIGARNGSILSQFLMEAVVLTTIGGLIGIALGLGLSYGSVLAINFFEPGWGVEFVLVPNAIMISCAVAVTVGIVFGLYPAMKAARLQAIEALRYE